MGSPSAGQSPAASLTLQLLSMEKEAKKLPFPACCLLPLSEIRIN